MPTIEQMDRLWMSGWRDDDRIGIGGFEAPNGRQWWEPERRQYPLDIGECKSIGYFIFNLEAGTERFITTIMLEDFTDSDDQDWIDFNELNKP